MTGGRHAGGSAGAREEESCDAQLRDTGVRGDSDAGRAACESSGAATEADGAQHVCAQGGRRYDRQRDGEQSALALDLVAVLAAARTGVEVVAQVRTAERAAGQRRELLADFL